MKTAKGKLIVFILLLVLTIGMLLLFTINGKTIEALKHFKFSYLGYIAAIWAAATTLDALIIFVLAKGAGENLSFINSYKLSGIRVLFNIITPFNMGGQPFMVYYMNSKKIPPGKGSSIVLTKVMITSIFVLLGAVTAFLIFFKSLTTLPAMNILFLTFGILQLGFIVLIVLSMKFPHFLIGLLQKLFGLLSRIKLIKHPEEFKKKVIQEAAQSRRCFRFYFKQHSVYFILALFFAALMYVAEASLFWVVLEMLGYHLPYLNGLILGILMFFILSFMPTPGGLGLGEAGIILLVSGMVPVHILGIAIVLWRFFYQILTSVIGIGASAGHFFNLTFSKNRKEYRV